MKTPRLSHAVLVVAAAFGGCTARLSAGTVRYNVVHLEAVYGADLNFSGMSKGGIVSAGSPSGFVRIENGIKTTYPATIFAGYYPFNDAGISYVVPNAPAPVALYTLRSNGDFANTGYVPAGDYLSLNGQNRLGAVVGLEAPVYDSVAGYNHNAGFIYSPTTGGQAIVQMGGVLVAEFHVVNDVGWLAGYGGDGTTGGHLYLWIPGQSAVSLVRTNSGAVSDMNNLGQLVGTAGVSAFFWNAGNLLYLGSMPVEDPAHPGVFNEATRWSFGGGISEAGLVSGFSVIDAVPGFPRPTSGSVGWIWSEAAGLELLDGLIDPNSGIQISSAGTIGDDGTIFASGRIPGYVGSQTLLLIPVPEPSGAALLALGLAALLLRRRR